jgi:parallel beta-helix repeat protein
MKMARLRTWKGLSILVALALVLALGAVAVLVAGKTQAAPGTIHVDDDAPGCVSGPQVDPYSVVYCNIQDAIDDADPGDTILVHPGTYHENVDVDKDHLTIRSYSGNPSNTTVDGDGNDDVFDVTADYVTISGFTITGGRLLGAGVHLYYADYCEISHNTITDNTEGIYLENSHHNTMKDNFISQNWFSCPFVYSWDGEGYRLDSFVFTWSYRQALESTDYDNLEYLTPADGKYSLKMSEELFEISYVNELKIMVVDHPDGTQIVPDALGNIHTLRDPYAPIAGEEEDGTDCLGKVKDRDGTCWTSNPDNKDLSKEEDLRDGIILTFDKPEAAQIAKVVVNFQTTKLVDDISINLLKLEGEKRDEGLCARLNLDPSEVEAMYELLYLLHLKVWNGSEWVSEGTFFPEPGSWISRDDIKTIDVSGIEGNTIKIKLESLTGLVQIDAVRMDFSADEAVITTELSATTAVDANGTDVAPEILANDDQYLVLEQGDYAYLSFDEIAATPIYDRSYIIKARGYYQGLVAAEGEAQDELLRKLLTDYPYAARYFLERYDSYRGHCGIYLYRSDDNTVSANKIADNSPDEGIHLYYSNSNQIVDNDIHNNEHGIHLQYSNDNEIALNDILNNTGIDSGIHLESGCSGNIAHCNNIEGNGPYGVWNDPANPRLDATNNWWGSADGPSLSPGSGDRVNDNVDYEPWLPTQFQYCRECGGAPPPPKVPTINHWGIVAMISLFAGLLAWRMRRRRLAS